MKSPYVSELQPNQIVTATFLVLQKDIRQKKSGDPCLSLILGDRTGDVEARMWDNVADVLDTFDRDDFLRVRGLLQVHQNRLQLIVHKLQRQSSDAIDVTDFYPASERSSEEMWTELTGLAENLQNTHLKGLMLLLLNDPEIAKRYKIAPAAKNVHHAFLGGLLEHVLSMCGLAKLTAAHYKDIDIDLLLAGVMLHDIGKIHELTYDRSFGYSSEGQLLGHILIGLRMIDDKLRLLPDFPERLRTLLQHMIASHHGSMEFGSPKVPLFAEALLLHHLDNLDSKMDCMRSCVQRDRAVDGCWTGYSSSLERAVLKKSKYLDGAADVPTAKPASPPRSCETPIASPPPRSSTSVFADKLQNALKGNGNA